jgi:hypothetical protein
MFPFRTLIKGFEISVIQDICARNIAAKPDKFDLILSEVHYLWTVHFYSLLQHRGESENYGYTRHPLDKFCSCQYNPLPAFDKRLNEWLPILYCSAVSNILLKNSDCWQFIAMTRNIGNGLQIRVFNCEESNMAGS